MTRLALALQAPAAYAGESVACELEIRSSEPFAQLSVLVTAISRHGFRLGLATAAHVTGDTRVVETTIASHGARLDQIAAGLTTIPFTISVPAETPPSHDAFGVAFAQVTVEAIVDSSLGRVESSFPLVVYERPAKTEPLPTTVSSPTAVHRLELSVATSRLGLGDTVAGTCAAINMKDHRPRTVKLSVTGTLVTPADGDAQPIEVRRAVHVQDLTLPAGIGSAAVPFAFPLPAMFPTLEADTHVVRWALVGSTDKYFFEGPAEATLPLEIVAPGAIAAAAEPPEIGVPKIGELLEQVAAQRGWQLELAVASDPDLGVIYPRLLIDADPIRIWAGVAYRDGSIALVAGLHYRSLELGLEVVRSSALRELFSPRDLESGIDDWDRKHRVHARDADGAVAVLRAVVPVLGRLGAVVRWTDVELICERAVTAAEIIALPELADGARVAGRAFESLTGRADGPYR